MESSNFSVHKFETHPTKDVSDSHINGSLTVVWRDWDKIIKDPQMKKNQEHREHFSIKVLL